MKRLYRNLIKDGWKLTEIDEMDIHFFFEILAMDDQKNEVRQATDEEIDAMF